ncbi:unnamed protein product [Strongylus vulgaris]|uniref:Uncharacterized protein n=1 Tax=Strongylus vulgaris TaxID=40348 RepID=A0A3P7LIW0_STRVU|nr:unnamed protein product [Strongylus vulgaris]
MSFQRNPFKTGLAHSIILNDPVIGLMHWVPELESKRDFLLRGDLEIDWRPLFELYVEVSYKNLEEDGIFLMPDGFRAELQAYISHARRYFSDDAPQQLLDELRPLMCVWDESIVRAWRLLELFMPMNLPPERQLTHGKLIVVHYGLMKRGIGLSPLRTTIWSKVPYSRCLLGELYNDLKRARM